MLRNTFLGSTNKISRPLWFTFCFIFKAIYNSPCINNIYFPFFSYNAPVGTLLHLRNTLAIFFISVLDGSTIYNIARIFAYSNSIAGACFIFPLSTLMTSYSVNYILYTLPRYIVLVSLAILPRRLPSASIAQQYTIKR